MRIEEFRILQVSASASEILGGPSKVVVAVSGYLKKMNPKNSTLVFGQNSLELPNATEIKTLFGNRFGFPSNFFSQRMRRIISNHEILIVHGFYLYSTIYSIYISKSNSIFLMPHGSLELYQEQRGKIKKKIFLYFLEKSLRGRKIHFILGSESEVSSVRKKFPHNKISVVGLGTNPIVTRIGGDYVSPLQRKNLLCISRIAPKKRIDLAIRALSELKIQGLNYHLDIAGDGDYDLRKNLEDLAESLGVAASITWHNFVSGLEKDKLFRHARIFMLPSENENFAIAVAESIDHGVPVVVSKYVAMHSFVDFHKTGVTIHDLEPKSIVEAIKDIEQSYLTYVSNCHSSSVFLHWDNVFLNWTSVLEKNIGV